ncbi:MAG: nuclear transport factor 2 family protein [Gammaproteobacteria bacterium]|nr:nuclear transport factor 2 family protein [Gammaproteobacteria bacterium]
MENSTLSAKLDIQELAARYCDGADRQEWEKVVALFEEDGEFDASSVYGQTMHGHAEILQFMRSAPACLGHHPTGLFSTIESESAARARLKMLTLFKSSTFTVDYDWELTRTNGQWRIKKQVISVISQQSHRAHRESA